MAKRKKVFTYKFMDGEQSFPSSLYVICTESGEKVKMYHKQLVKLIKRKYNNNYKLFKASYVKKGNRINIKEINDYDIRPEGYRKYLITAYLHFKNSSLYSESEKRGRMTFLNDCYQKRWDDTLEDRSRLAEL